jgi:hypothetical protein
VEIWLVDLGLEIGIMKTKLLGIGVVKGIYWDFEGNAR